MAPVLEVTNLVKRFPKITAVAGVSFAISEGKCFGLLGPNGAGKTTTIEILEGIQTPTEGEIRYRGAPRGEGFAEKIGIQFQSSSLQDFLTVREVISLFSSFYRAPTNLDSLVSRCALGEFLDREAVKLSGGQRQRVLLALALINDPDVLFLDEPTTGLDPQARRAFWALERDIKREGRTIVLSTHYMEEAQQLCDEIAIMDHGRIIERGEPRALLKQYVEAPTLEDLFLHLTGPGRPPSGEETP